MPKKGSNAEWSLSDEHRSSQPTNPEKDSTPNSAKESISHQGANPRLSSVSGVGYFSPGQTSPDNPSLDLPPTENVSNWHVSFSNDETVDTVMDDTSDSDVVIIQPRAQVEPRASVQPEQSPPPKATHKTESEYQPEFVKPKSDHYHHTDSSSGQSSIDNSFADHSDDVVIAQLAERHYTVAPGESVTVDIGLVNNDTQIGVFSPQIVGSIPKQWMSITPSHTRLHPGEQTTLTVTIEPPRKSTLRSGVYPLAVIIRMGGPGGRFCQIGLQLHIEPFTQLQVGSLQPKKVKVGWRHPTESMILPITNIGNVATEIMLDGQDRYRAYDFYFGMFSVGQSTAGQRQFALLPGQTHYAPVTVRYRNPNIFGIKRGATPFNITAYTRALSQADKKSTASDMMTQQSPIIPDEEPWVASYQTSGKATYAPLIGPGTLLSVAGAGIVGMLAVVVTLLLIILSLYPRTQTIPIVVTPVVNSPSQAALEIIVKVNEEVPTSNAAPAPVVPEGVQEMALASVAEAVPTAIVVRPLAVEAAPESTNSESAPVNVAGREAGQEAAPVQQSIPQEQTQLATPNSIDVANIQSQPDNGTSLNAAGGVGVPIVRADMITGPGETAATNGGFQTSSIEAAAVNGLQPATAGGAPRDSVNAPSNASGPTASTEQDNPKPTGMTYEQMFRQVAVDYNLDWRVLAAQAYIESSFNPMAMGKRGDLGLMQILPTTWQEWAPQVQAEDPFDSYSNVRVAARYTIYLREQLAKRDLQEDKWILVAYNWGPARVIDFVEAGGNWDALSDQRKKYAQDIIRIANSLPGN